jgi:PAS domain S-box-containing protein
VTARLFRSFQYVLLAATAALVLAFYFQTRLEDLDHHNAHAQDILRLKQFDTLLEHEALRTISLQTTQYDPIVNTVEHIRALLRTLSSPALGIEDMLGPHNGQINQKYNTMMEAKIDLVETIKSRTAIVRNTLNFLPLEVARLTHERNDMLSVNLNRMLSALLAQNINPTPHNLETVEHLLDELDNMQTVGISPEGLQRVITHARTNLKANADVNTVMAEFLALPTRDTLDVIFNAHADFVLQRIKSANEFRTILLAITLSLVAALAIALHRMQKAHDQLQQTSRQFQDAVESISEGFAFFDRRGKLQFWNTTFARLHQNCAPSLTKGINYEAFYAACVKSGIYQARDIPLTRTTNTPFEIHTADNTWMLASDSPMADGGTACVRIDITQNKMAEDELRKLSRAVEQSPASVIITDTDGIISYVNPKFSETTGYTAAEAIGQRPSLINSGERPQSEYEQMWSTISSGHEWRGEFHNKRKDGSLFWEYASISPIKNERGDITHFLAVKEDITEHKNTMAQLIQAKEQAELASHAKTQFLANMSHELRTPLNAIIGFSEILKGQLFGPLGSAQYVDYTANIHDSGMHLLEVINDILDISRIETGAMEIRESDVSLRHLAQVCLDMVFDHAEHAKLTIRLDLADDMPHVYADEMRIKQVMLNLLTNAIKFTPEGGNVTLKIYTTDDNKTCIAISDTGHGIPKNMHKRVLEPFEQVSDIYTRNHEGSGLGLYLVNAFVKLHGGRVDIDSDVGQGTTVTATLPASRTLKA